MELTDLDYNIINYCFFLSLKSKDPAKKVGCYITNAKNELIADGYNDMPKGFKDAKSCYKDFWNDKELKLAYVCHAELNAIVNAKSKKVKLEGTTLYCTLCPCNYCAKLIIQTGITKVVYMEKLSEKWNQPASEDMFKKANVTLLQISETMYIEHLWNRLVEM